MEVEVNTTGLTEFEFQRARLIARNRARLLALGIPEAVSGLTKLAPATAAAPPKPKKPRAPKRAAPAEPTRHSNRLRDQELIARGEVPPDVKPGSELAQFIIEDQCPRCGREFIKGHARHLQKCSIPPVPPKPPADEENAAQVERYKVKEKEKLKQLELGGLVDYFPGGSSSSRTAAEQKQPAAAAAAADNTAAEAPAPKRRRRSAAAAAKSAAVEADQQQQHGKPEGKITKGKKAPAAAAAAAGKPKNSAAAAEDEPAEAYATFTVIGSTGNPYVVKLSDSERSCTCMDHRVRQRDCKHIRLIWQELGVTEEPWEWQKALEQHLNDVAEAEESDVVIMHEAEPRGKARADKQAAAANKKRS